jgi:acyl-CoA thioester hydrolase
VWEKHIAVRWRDLDSSGHVNNAVYLTYLEEGRSEWLARVLGGRERVEGFVLARIAVDFRREVTLADGEVVVRCRLDRIGTASVTLAEEVRTAAGEVAASAEAVMVARDEASRTSRPLTDAERAALEQG